MHLLSVLATALAIRGAASLTPAEWRKQSIYQVMTDRFARSDGSTTAACDTSQQIYCGGSWQGLIDRLSYIQGMGFTAIWISPVVGQMSGDTEDGESYHGYWAQDIYDTNSAFGASSDLVALSAAVHDLGMYLMVDVVTNHMAYDGCGDCVDYSIFDPFSSESYFHPFCLIDYSNQTSIEVCWEGDNIVSLPDLRTEDSDVRTIFNDWIAQMVSTYSIDGLRMDSVEEIEMSFWPGFEAAAGVYLVGEVFNGNPSYVAPYQEYISGLLNYPAYFWITQAFEATDGSISNLANGINTLKSDAVNTSLYGNFLENHDNPRFPSLTSDMSLAKNAIAFTMLLDGIPIIYEGQEQHYSGGATPNNREAIWLSGYPTTSTLYTFITTVNSIRSHAIAMDSNYLIYEAYPVYSDTHSIAMRKGYAGYQIVGVFTNVGSSSSASVTLTSSDTGFTASQAVVDVLTCTTFTTDSSGSLSITLSSGLPRVFYPSTALSGSGLCGSSTTTTASGTTSTTTTSGATSTGTSCTATSVAITFDELVTTVYGDTIKICGNDSTLGDWDTSDAVALSASQYTSSDPLWSGTVSFAPGSVIQYKYINVDSSGDVTWEADPNHTYTVPCATATVSNTWQS